MSTEQLSLVWLVLSCYLLAPQLFILLLFDYAVNCLKHDSKHTVNQMITPRLQRPLSHELLMRMIQ